MVEREGDLVLRVVVWIDQVQAAAVHVHRQFEDTASHRVALEMPARGPRAPAALPRGKGWVLPFPDHELAYGSLPTGERVVGLDDRVAGELRVHREVLPERPVRWRVDPQVPLPTDPSGPREGLHHADDLGDESARAGAVRRREDPERAHVPEEPRLLPPREGAPGEAELRGPVVDLVLEVRHVHHVADRRSLGGEEPTDDVEEQVGPCVTHVSRVVHRRPADVEGHWGAGPRSDGPTLPGAGVLQPERHDGGIGVPSRITLWERVTRTPLRKLDGEGVRC